MYFYKQLALSQQHHRRRGALSDIVNPIGNCHVESEIVTSNRKLSKCTGKSRKLSTSRPSVPPPAVNFFLGNWEKKSSLTSSSDVSNSIYSLSNLLNSLTFLVLSKCFNKMPTGRYLRRLDRKRLLLAFCVVHRSAKQVFEEIFGNDVNEFSYRWLRHLRNKSLSATCNSYMYTVVKKWM